MIINLPVKQPSEKWYIPFDFSNPLNSTSNPDSTEDIGQVLAAEAADVATDEDVSDDIVDAALNQISGQVAYIWIKGGTTGHRYKITVRIETAVSKQVFELEAYLFVREF